MLNNYCWILFDCLFVCLDKCPRTKLFSLTKLRVRSNKDKPCEWDACRELPNYVNSLGMKLFGEIQAYSIPPLVTGRLLFFSLLLVFKKKESEIEQIESPQNSLLFMTFSCFIWVKLLTWLQTWIISKSPKSCFW